MTVRIFKSDMSYILDKTIHSIQPVISHLQIEELKHDTADLGSAASSHYARSLCSMPNLRSLYLDDVKLSDEFYSTMATEASKSKVYPNMISIGNDLFRNSFAFFKLNIWGNCIFTLS